MFQLLFTVVRRKCSYLLSQQQPLQSPHSFHLSTQPTAKDRILKFHSHRLVSSDPSGKHPKSFMGKPVTAGHLVLILWVISLKALPASYSSDVTSALHFLGVLTDMGCGGTFRVWQYFFFKDISLATHIKNKHKNRIFLSLFIPLI